VLDTEQPTYGGLQTLELGALEVRPTKVALNPFPTLLAVLDSVSGRDITAREPWRGAVLGAFEGDDLEALRPITHRPQAFLPDNLIWVPNGGPIVPEDELERIASLDPCLILDDLSTDDGPGIVGPWIEVARDPNKWLDRYVKAFGHAWAGLRPLWCQASGALGHEVERIGVAAARGAVGELLTSVRPDVCIDSGDVTMITPCAANTVVRIDDSGLALMPALTGDSRRVLRIFENGALSHLAYLVPDAARIAVGPPRPAPDSLEALLGRARATILTHLDHPQRIGALAELLGAVPSAATHHVGALESAGLAERERQSQHVVVRRTAHGSALLELYRER
jgi:DNA-binding transcriptional ArsR family regulator